MVSVADGCGDGADSGEEFQEKTVVGRPFAVHCGDKLSEPLNHVGGLQGHRVVLVEYVGLVDDTVAHVLAVVSTADLGRQENDGRVWFSRAAKGRLLLYLRRLRSCGVMALIMSSSKLLSTHFP